MHLLRILLLGLTLVLPKSVTASSGFLLVIGGGGEKFTDTSWEREPYQWAVDQSENRRVAIISFYSQSNALPDFFVSELEAAAAKNFLINSKQAADSQAIYDSLKTYDVIFLKGGDQYNYYQHYRGTLTEQAIREKFQQGGVICGTSAGLAVLGGVDYVAANASADPGEALENPLNRDITLENDFLPMIPGVIFDSHFAERGRFGRLLGFLASWEMETGENLLGIGVDDATALAIDTSMVATVYGTGAASFYRAVSPGTFGIDGQKLVADSVEVMQLLHHCSYDFSTGTTTGLETQLEYSRVGETGNYTVLISGGNDLTSNIPMLEALVNGTGSPDDPILIVTRSVPATALEFQEQMTQLGATRIELGAATLSMAFDESLRSTIENAGKILFIDLNTAELLAFMSNGPTGEALTDRIRSNGMVTAFVGGLGGLAGKVLVEGADIEGASYEGGMIFSEGLGLLSETVVLTNTWESSSLYENRATAVPYAMVTNSLLHGVWLSQGNYLKYSPANGKTYFQGFGTTPVMILKNKAIYGDISDQTSYGDGKDHPRMVAGFDRMTLALLSDTSSSLAGNAVFQTSTGEKTAGAFSQVYPNPVSGMLNLQSAGPAFPRILSMDGRVLWMGSSSGGSMAIPVDHLPDGLYILTLDTDFNTNQRLYKIQVKNR